ncbi:phospholipase D-like domain-containing protein [Priestia megaterium]|uniref:phospholipase D-like domain-containing protein n=1 Tax=Priestia megaterium TaxID=1404 RepID=UPI0035DDF567
MTLSPEKYAKLRMERVIDNREISMAEVIQDLLPSAQHLDIAVGYFYLTGFSYLQEHINSFMENPNANIRIIMGNQTNTETLSILENGLAPKEVALRDAKMTAEEEMPEKLHEIVKWMRERRLQIKVYTGPANYFHAKSYLFNTSSFGRKEGYAIVGSSNFSKNGLTGNTELNTLSQDNFYALSNWFDTIWNSTEVKDFSPELLKTVIENLPKKSKDLQYYLTPRATYFEFAKRYGVPIVEPPTGDYMDTLFEHQTVGVAEIKNRLERYGTAILSDSVGLGKTRTAAAVIRALGEPKTLLVIARKLQKQWRDEMAIVGCDFNQYGFITKEELARMGVHDLNSIAEHYNLIIVDEAHQGLKNAGTKLYKNLEHIVGHAKEEGLVIKGLLLTATPWNNSRSDIFNLGTLFLDCHRVSGSRAYNEYLHYSVRKAARAFETDNDAFREFWTDLFLQRTRKTYGGASVSFATRVFPTVEVIYEPAKEKAFAANYDRISELALPHMDPMRYAGEGDTFTSDRLKLLFLKRADSSWIAFEQSLLNIEGKLKDFLRDISYTEGATDLTRALHLQLAKWYRLDESFEGNLFSGGMDDDMDLLTSYEINSRENRGRYVKKMLKKIDSIKKSQAKKMVSALRIDAEKDLLRLSEIRKDLADAFARKDEKYEAVRDTLHQQASMGEKVLLITQFRDTAINYFNRFIKDKKLEGLRIGLVTGQVEDIRINNSKINYTKEEVLRRFAPTAKLAREYQGSDDELDIVIGTDTLSIGQNLQDASILMNLDLPFNPMSLEQRIGRIDRPRKDGVHVIKIYTFPSMPIIEAELKMTERLRKKLQGIFKDTHFDDLVLPEYEDYLKSILLERKASQHATEDMLDKTMEKHTVTVNAEEHSVQYVEAQRNLWEFVRSQHSLPLVNDLVDQTASYKLNGSTVFMAKTTLRDVNGKVIRELEGMFLVNGQQLVENQLVPTERAWRSALNGYAYTTLDIKKEVAMAAKDKLKKFLKEITEQQVNQHNEKILQKGDLEERLSDNKVNEVAASIRRSASGPNRQLIAQRMHEAGYPKSLKDVLEALKYIDRLDPEYVYVEELHENIDKLWEDYSLYYEALRDRSRRNVPQEQPLKQRNGFQASHELSDTEWLFGHIAIQ